MELVCVKLSEVENRTDTAVTALNRVQSRLSALISWHTWLRVFFEWLLSVCKPMSENMCGLRTLQGFQPRRRAANEPAPAQKNYSELLKGGIPAKFTFRQFFCRIRKCPKNPKKVCQFSRFKIIGNANIVGVIYSCQISQKLYLYNTSCYSAHNSLNK